jgi:outer membrane protein insertion porin family
MATLAVLGSSAVVRAAAEDRPVVAEVVIQGCRTVHPDRVRFLLGTRAGDPIDYDILADDVRAIERLGPFTGTAVTQRLDPATGKVTVVFTVVELPFVGAVRFANLNYFQRSGLEDKIGTKAGQYLNPLVLENDRKALDRYFQDKGYAGAAFTVATPQADGIATVVFTAQLGHQVEVGRVLLPGLPPRVLERTIHGALINAPSAIYQPEMLALDTTTVRLTLQDLGWLDAQVAPVQVYAYDFVRPEEDRRHHGPQFAPDGRQDDRMVLQYDITAGEPWQLGSVSFVGNTVATSEELRSAFGLPAGTRFKRVDIERAIGRAERIVQNQGYARCSIRQDRSPDPATHTVNLTLHVVEGDLYTLDRADVNGNFRTKDAVVRRALRLHPGQLWNEDDLDRSKVLINRTGLFKNTPQQSTRLAPHFDEDRPGRVDLVTDVNEDSTGQFRVQVGYSSSSGIFGELGYQEHNFDLLKAATLQGWRGGGQTLDVNVSASQERTSTGVSWANPSLFDGPYSLSVAFNRSDSTRLEWDEKRMASSIGIGRSFLDNDLKLNLSYTYTDLNISDVGDHAPDDALVGAGDYFLNTLMLRQIFDRLDSPRLPTRGYRLQLSEAFTGVPLTASSDHFEWTAKGDLYIPLHTMDLGGVINLHLNERWQQLYPINGDNRVPFYERYYGGGPSPRHRGFDSGDLSPASVNTNGFNAKTGGIIDTLASAELSIPLQGENDKLRLVLFTDYGDVLGEGDTIDPLDWRTAVGFGIRFPVQLPIALDFAWLIDPRTGERENQIHFALGFASF